MRVIDLMALVLALPLATTLLRHVAPRAVHAVNDQALELVVAIVAWAATSALLDVYGAAAPASSERNRVVVALALAGLVVGAFGFFSKLPAFSRLLTGSYFAVSAALLLAARSTHRLFARASARKGARRFAVVGSGALAREILDAIHAHPEWGLDLAGLVLLDGDRGARPRGPVLGRLSGLGHILEEQVLDLVVFAVPRDQLATIEGAILLCEEQGVDVHLSLDVLRYGRAQMALADLDGVPVLAFTRKPSDSLALGTKRVFDVVVSLLLLLLLSPLLIAIAIAIRLEGRGPIFFRQRRVGVHGRTFEMVKFRSMHVDAEARLEALRASNEMSGPVFKMRNDPRITRVGAFLRRTSLDELPQFFNVLLGEMSVVGPRPPLPAEVKQYKRWQRRRLSVKPGITCTWQVSGRNDIDFDRWMELDLEYIDSWSLWRDLKICFQTIPAVIGARGAR
jgi:exopolysaccharide biosynthesis polyprenyl glycosylphosphotransferase